MNKQAVLVIVSVAAVALAGFIAWRSMSGGEARAASGAMFLCREAACGKEFRLEDVAAPAGAEVGAAPTATCPACGSSNVEPARQCPTCKKAIAKNAIKHTGAADAPPPKCPHCGAAMPPLLPS